MQKIFDKKNRVTRNRQEFDTTLKLLVQTVTCVLVFEVSFPLSAAAEAVKTFGPLHVPTATRGYENENLFVVLANHKSWPPII